MRKHRQRGWLDTLFARRRPATIRRHDRTRLGVERFENRDLPSASIPLNGLTWTSIGPSPIAAGQSPGSPASTGRVNDIAVNSANPDIMYAGADTGGIWKTTDSGRTWSPRTDQTELLISQIETVTRAAGDTVYAFTADGRFIRSLDGMNTFTTSAPFPSPLVANQLVVSVTDPADQTKDILFAATSLGFLAIGGIEVAGIWRSLDGGTTWAKITQQTQPPFGQTLNPNALEFTDVDLDPRSPNIAYASVGSILGDPRNGVYRSTDALSPNPQWQLLIGGSSFLPGSTPGPIKVAVSPVLPSTIFAALALRADPRTGANPLLGVFRSTDSGVNWTPVVLADPTNQTADPRNYMRIFGEDNNMIVVSPFSPADPTQQIVYVGGFGLANNVLLSTNSGNSFATTASDIGIGANGVGAYPNVHEGVIDSQGRLVIATGGGVYRLENTNPVTWASLNGDIGPNALGVVQFNGFAMHPTDPNRAIGNITNQFVRIHNAVLFSDTFGAGNAAYGWTTVDANGIDGNTGSGQVIYNTFNPSIVYRVTDGSAGNPAIRQSTDGGLTWQPAVNGFQPYPFQGGFYVVPIAMDPSRPNRLFGGYTRVFATDDDANNWREAVQVSTTGATVAIPAMPIYAVNAQGGGPIPLTALGTGRQTNAIGPTGFFFNGTAVYVASQFDAAREADGDPDNAIDFLQGSPLYMTVIPDTLPWPPQNTQWGERAWVRITPDVDGDGFPDSFGFIKQILVDPTNSNRIYVVDSAGQVFRGQLGEFNFIFGGAQANRIEGNLTVTWENLTSNLPPGGFAITAERGQLLALDTRALTDPTDDFLYAGTEAGVWRLLNPGADFSTVAPVWEEVGLTATGQRSMPAVPVTALSLNTTTGILGAATYGRGAYEIQIRGLIRGQVFDDLNGNGIREQNEPPRPSVVVRVLDVNANNAEIASTVSDANGVYEFRSLRNGNYRVVISGPLGVFQTTAPVNDLNVTEQSTFDNANFGYFTAGAVTGFVFQDNNGNGVFDGGEPPIVGMTVFSDRNNNGTLDAGEPSVVTAANGGYIFSGFGPDVINGNPNDPASGPFNIRVVGRPGLSPTVPASGVARIVSITSGQTATGVNFGFRSGGGGPGPGPGPVPGGQRAIVTALDTDGAPVITIRNQTTGQTRTINAYALAFRGGVRVASADFNSDGTPDVVTGPGPGGGPHVRVFDGATGGLITEFMAYDTAFRGGVYVAAGDVNGDGTPDVITGAGANGGPHVKVVSGRDLSVIYSFFAYSPSFFGGVTVAAGDVNGDNRADIITGAGPGGGPHVKAFSGADLSLLSSFFAYAGTFRGGVFVGAGDVSGDSRADILTGPGQGGSADIRAFDAATGRQFTGFQAFPNSGFITAQSSGARVASTDFDSDGVSDFVVSSGRGRTPLVRVFSGRTLQLLSEVNAADPSFLGGVFVAGV